MVSSDPVSLAAERVGTIGVPVACNDVAATGGDPAWLTVVLFVPEDDPGVLDVVTAQVHEAARETGVTVVGGHTEYNPDLPRPLLSLTAPGMADRVVPTGGAAPGDRVLLTTGAGIEGTAILATDFRGRATEGGLAPEVCERAAGFFEELSVLPEARALGGDATAMHDPTEGGIIDGLLELATASGTVIAVDREAIPVREETRTLCDAFDVDPLCVFGSGAVACDGPTRGHGPGPVDPRGRGHRGGRNRRGPGRVTPGGRRRRRAIRTTGPGRPLSPVGVAPRVAAQNSRVSSSRWSRPGRVPP